VSSKAPVAVVGVSWRSASTQVRAQLAGLDAERDPVRELQAAGYVTGAVRVATCSRTEWILTADNPDWAATLLKGALLSRVEGLDAEQLHVRSGGASVHYLLRVAVGLDSVAEGEGAVGRQVLKAFEHARSAGLTDRRMRLVWKQVERLIRARRDKTPGAQSRGVQSLVRDALKEHPVSTVAILGRGDFGLAIERALRAAGRFEVTTWSRQTLDELKAGVEGFDAVVVCTGGGKAWLELPPRVRPGLCIDAGSPPQVVPSAGWKLLGLDALLSRPDIELGEDERERLEQLVLGATRDLSKALASRSTSPTLAAIDAERTAFLNERLPSLLVGLPKAQVRKVKQAVGAFTHAILKKTREVSS
jgi:glutamyl-tRNA reductase